MQTFLDQNKTTLLSLAAGIFLGISATYLLTREPALPEDKPKAHKVNFAELPQPPRPQQPHNHKFIYFDPNGQMYTQDEMQKSGLSQSQFTRIKVRLSEQER